jgi:hypothetical protein
VLADMFNSIIEVAAVQEDYRVVLAALELACAISCQPGKQHREPGCMLPVTGLQQAQQRLCCG